MDHDIELLEISGTVDSVIYKNEDNGYTVLRLTDENGENITVVGCFPYAACGESMIVSGTWMNHNVHGRQFKAAFAQRLMPTGERAIYEYLAGGAVKGIGPATASILVALWGQNPGDSGERSGPAGLHQRHQPGQGASDVQELSAAGRNAPPDGVYLLLWPAPDPGHAYV